MDPKKQDVKDAAAMKFFVAWIDAEVGTFTSPEDQAALLASRNVLLKALPGYVPGEEDEGETWDVGTCPGCGAKGFACVCGKAFFLADEA